MKVGDLVRIKQNEDKGLYIIMDVMPYNENAFVRLYSIKNDKICYGMALELEVINESR